MFVEVHGVGTAGSEMVDDEVRRKAAQSLRSLLQAVAVGELNASATLVHYLEGAAEGLALPRNNSKRSFDVIVAE